MTLAAFLLQCAWIHFFWFYFVGEQVLFINVYPRQAEAPSWSPRIKKAVSFMHPPCHRDLSAARLV
jgi:hypothetical protein